jgi:hypothetical protein
MSGESSRIYSPFDGIFETSDLCDSGYIDIDEDRNIRGCALMGFNVFLIFLNIPRIRRTSREHSVDPTTLVAKRANNVDTSSTQDVPCRRSSPIFDPS